MNPGSLPQWATLIAQLGFPVVVATYLMVRFDNLISRLIECEASENVMLAELKEAVHSLSASVDRLNGKR